MNASAKKEISKILGSIHDRDHYSVVRDFFELSAISIRNVVDYGKDHKSLEKRYMDVAKSYSKPQLEEFSRALGLLAGEIGKAVQGIAPFSDWAGEIYMDSGTSNGKAGQFFTPYSVSRCMAEINFPKEEVLAKLEGDSDRVITIYEPTCGAGGLIVASIDALHTAGVNYSWNAFVDCGDIDPRCVHMTYTTLSLLGVPAVVRLGDALMMKYHEAWFTPAYLMAWPHFKSRIGRGGYPYEPTVKEPSRSQEKAAADAESPKAADVPRMPEIMPKVEKNGQFCLF